MLVAFGQLHVALMPDYEGRVRCYLSGGVHPQWRGRGIGRRLMDRMETRALALAGERHPGVPAYFSARGELEGSSARRMLVHRGYAIVRYFNELTRAVPGEPLPTPEPYGITLITPRDEHEEAARVAHNAAFADHWGAIDTIAERWHDYWTAKVNRMTLSTLAVDAEGTVLSYVMTAEYAPRELYVTSSARCRRAADVDWRRRASPAPSAWPPSREGSTSPSSMSTRRARPVRPGSTSASASG